MYNYLVDNAIQNVWCSPDRDLQSIVDLARLTPAAGVLNVVQIQWQTYTLPKQSVRFHVYQVGQIAPQLMGLFDSILTWTTLARACNTQRMIIDLYTSKGLQFPRTQAWFMVTKDHNLVLAVQAQPNIPVDLGSNELYMRVYTNAYFTTLASNPLTDFITVGGQTVQYQSDILAIQNAFESLQKLQGQVYAFINGYKVDALNLLTVQPDDVVEYVYDSSILKVVDFPINALPSFQSTLDSEFKYLLHQAGVGESVIEYLDDNDIWLLAPGANGATSGVYYHRNALDAVRMVTHKDYAVPVGRVLSYVADGSTMADLTTMTLRIHVRKSGYTRPLVNEANRIEELYKLADQDLVAAMLGLNSVVPNWQVATLESSAYVQIMGDTAAQVTPALVETAYGYNAISKLLGDTPALTYQESGLMMVAVPYGLTANSSVYEYDVNGMLLGMSPHVLGSVHACSSFQAYRAEILSGVAGQSVDDYYGDVPVTVDPNLNYRFYTAPLGTKNWTDVTGGGLYSIISGKVTWFVDRTQFQTLVRSDAQILSYQLSLNPADGVFKFSLEQNQTRNGVTSLYVMEIPQGELDLFLNGQSLVLGVDYFVNFPEITVVNKRFLINPMQQAQMFTIRSMGFCRSDLTMEPLLDTGFTEYGMLSYNNRFDIRDDKVLRIVVGGMMKDRSELDFSETDSGVYVPNYPNGLPYQIRDIVVPMRIETPHDTYTLRAESQATDVAISNYLTLKLPEAVKTGLNTIPKYWEVVSPFTQKLISDLNSGVLNDPKIFVQFNDQDVRNICAPYLPLLAFDPTQPNTLVDSRYVAVVPHCLDTVVAMGIYQQRFLARAVNIYMNGLVDLAPFISVETF